MTTGRRKGVAWLGATIVAAITGFAVLQNTTPTKKDGAKTEVLPSQERAEDAKTTDETTEKSTTTNQTETKTDASGETKTITSKTETKTTTPPADTKTDTSSAKPDKTGETTGG